MLSRCARLGGTALARSSALAQLGAVRRLAAPPSLPPTGPKHYDPLMPDLVLEEEDSGVEAGLPFIKEKDIWANPDMLLPERHELVWDDGTAVQEWYVDRSWPVSNGQAAKELLTVLSVLIFGVGGLAYAVGDSGRTAVPRSECWPVEKDEWRKQELGSKLVDEATGKLPLGYTISSGGEEEEEGEE